MRRVDASARQARAGRVMSYIRKMRAMRPRDAYERCAACSSGVTRLREVSLRECR